MNSTPQQSTPVFNIKHCRLVPFLVAGVLLAGCSSTDSSSTNSSETSQESSTVATSAAPTSASTSTKPSSSPDASSSAADQGGDLEVVEGVRTSAFFEMPETIAGMQKTDFKVDNPNREAEIFYKDSATEEQMRFRAFFPQVSADEKIAVPDDRKEEAIDNFVEGYQKETGNDFPEREVNTPEYEFTCAGGIGTESNHYQEICVTIFAGRVVDFQRSSPATTTDGQDQLTDRIAGDLAKALAALPKEG